MSTTLESTAAVLRLQCHRPPARPSLLPPVPPAIGALDLNPEASVADAVRAIESDATARKCARASPSCRPWAIPAAAAALTSDMVSRPPSPSPSLPRLAVDRRRSPSPVLHRPPARPSLASASATGDRPRPRPESRSECRGRCSGHRERCDGAQDARGPRRRAGPGRFGRGGSRLDLRHGVPTALAQRSAGACARLDSRGASGSTRCRHRERVRRGVERLDRGRRERPAVLGTPGPADLRPGGGRRDGANDLLASVLPAQQPDADHES